jgi:hypothetical protein
MKGKTLLSLAIVAAMLLSAMPLMAVKARPGAIVEIRFENGLNEITKAVCNNFDVTVYVTLTPGTQIDFTDLEIHWDPAVLELQTGTSADVIEGNWMKSFGSTVFVCSEPDNVAGILPDIGCGYLAGGPASGEGDFCKIKFHAKDLGDPTLILIWLPGMETWFLLGPNLVPIDATIDGTVHIPIPPATPPIAVFSLSPSYPTGTIIALVGTGSTDGYDTLPAPGHTCPITTWTWEIDEGNDGSIEYTLLGSTQSYTANVAGSVGVTLTVLAPDPTPPTAPTYVNNGSKKVVITVFTPPTGANIDIWTDRGGEGPHIPSDAYGPQEEVCVHAKVTYNNEPVEYKPVGFEVVDPDGASRDFRVAFTDADGMATVCFRIPWVGHDAETLFGVWNITATVDISQHVVSDWVTFRFGYLVSIVDMTVTPGSLHKLETMTIHVTLYNICFVSKNVYVTTVACDECGVPIGLYCDWFTADPDTSTVFTATIGIPSWAFVGQGIIYGNVFTEHPAYGGVPYCPEATVPFIILPTP